jgi:carboxylesterase
MTDSTGTLFLMLPGLCSSPEELNSVQRILERHGFHTLAVTIPGYSFDPDKTQQVATPFETWLELLHEQILHERAGFERITLVGLSSGANLALALSIKYPRSVDALVLLSTSIWVDGWSIPFYHWLLPLALFTPLGVFWKYREKEPFGVKDERIRAWIKRELERRRISAAGASVLEIGHLKQNFRLRSFVKKHLPGSALPLALAIHSELDEVASLRNVRWLESHWPAHTLQTLILNNSYHMITIDQERHTVSEAVLSYAQAQKSPKRPPL